MMGHRSFLCLAVLSGLALAVPAPASAQLVPGLPGAVDRTLGGARDLIDPVEQVLGDVGNTTGDITRSAARDLARAQLQRSRDLAQRYPDRIALDDDGNAVRAGEVTVIDADAALIAAAQGSGFRLIEQVTLADLDLSYARFAAPANMPLSRALRQMRRLAGGRDVSSDPLHFASGALADSSDQPAEPRGGASPPRGAVNRRIGLIDGAVPTDTPGLARQQSFVRGNSRANDHAVAIASLITGARGVNGSAPDAALFVADVYGDDPAGGNATAIAGALGWMVREGVPVVVISLVGPPNALLARAVAAAHARGTLVVAAVGNDGPAAPPAYPASYPQAIAVTGVDGRNRPLIEAGRARKLDYAAPGADMAALGADGRIRAVRGTSFAAPLVAARLSAHLTGNGLAAAIRAVDREAVGRSPRTGRGIVCASCRTAPR